MGSNCLASCSIGCLFCCQRCNAEKLIQAFLFVPPPASYSVEEQPPAAGPGRELTDGGGRMVYVSEQLRALSFYQQATEHAEVRFLKNHRGERVPVVWVRRSSASSSGAAPQTEVHRKNTLVMLHAHGNATDIGMMMGPYFEFTKQLGVEVVGLEYSGYGMASGVPSVKNLQADIEAAYDYIVASGVPPDRIVAYGQSVGGGPVMGLAAKRKLAGVILHSPFMSGIQVIDPEPDGCCRPSCMFRCFDFFHNDRRMKTISCPAFVIHGQLDNIIPFYHGSRLAEAAPEPFRRPGYFPHGAGHNDIVEINAAAYFGEVSNFLHSLGERGERSWVNSEPPQQVEMMEPVGVLPFAEPAVGMDDGRYEQLRRNKPGKGDGRQPKPQPIGAPTEGERRLN